MTVLANANLNITNGGTLNVNTGGNLTVLSQIQFGGSDNTINLNGGILNHSSQTLELGGGLILGSGDILVGSAGINLGSVGNEGIISGTSASERFDIFGNISGSGTLENVKVYGNISVGNSSGLISANGLTLSSSSTLEMELGGLLAGSEYDQILVDGLFNLDGALDVVWYNNFEAAMGDTFTLFDLTGWTASSQTEIDDSSLIMALFGGYIIC